MEGRKYLFHPRLCIESSPRWGFHNYPPPWVIVSILMNTFHCSVCSFIVRTRVVCAYAYKISLFIFWLGYLATAYLSPISPSHMKHCAFVSLQWTYKNLRTWIVSYLWCIAPVVCIWVPSVCTSPIMYMFMEQFLNRFIVTTSNECFAHTKASTDLLHLRIIFVIQQLWACCIQFEHLLCTYQSTCIHGN